MQLISGFDMLILCVGLYGHRIVSYMTQNFL